MRRRFRARLPILIVALLALGAGGCGGGDDDADWETLRGADRLDEAPVSLGRDPAVELDLPMPGIIRLRLTPRR